jgi:hypothetical protein
MQRLLVAVERLVLQGGEGISTRLRLRREPHYPDANEPQMNVPGRRARARHWSQSGIGLLDGDVRATVEGRKR